MVEMADLGVVEDLLMVLGVVVSITIRRVETVLCRVWVLVVMALLPPEVVEEEKMILDLVGVVEEELEVVAVAAVGSQIRVHPVHYPVLGEAEGEIIVEEVIWWLAVVVPEVLFSWSLINYKFICQATNKFSKLLIKKMKINKNGC
jgi:hypothetical protein